MSLLQNRLANVVEGNISCFKGRKILINTICGQNRGFMNVKVGGRPTYTQLLLSPKDLTKRVSIFSEFNLYKFVLS